MKKLINDPKTVVDESVEGFGMAHPDLVTVTSDPLFVARAGGASAGKVGIVSGGGSGHEPLHAGFVGYGMLSAAVPGAVFTSPTPDPIVAATLAVDGGAGVLHIVKNYTGDVLNFETAADLADAEGVRVVSVIVDDDVAVKDSLYTAGRRGVAGTVFVEKVAGAAAERGDDLDAVAAIATKANSVTRTMGVALAAGIVPHAGSPASPWPTTRSRSASASTASPGASGSSSSPPIGSSTDCWRRSWRTCRSKRETRSCCSSTAWVALR
ncbi:hypothetical protein GCM10025867_27180 [Frondihabitans sucicola]|uniref:DhaK domain-containing protein n=1 Tax=Frondihabitans sucicola TaxID=1268041 RepID=A0ABM8GPU7_9MICO|nr:hypothetical protein GCM10025867_27180 [Frondihabitans sucicola]